MIFYKSSIALLKMKGIGKLALQIIRAFGLLYNLCLSGYFEGNSVFNF